MKNPQMKNQRFQSWRLSVDYDWSMEVLGIIANILQTSFRTIHHSLRVH